MFKIRQGVFETNSSSMHSIAVNYLDKDNTPHFDKFKFHVGEFGWEHDHYYGLGDYIWTYLCERYCNDITTLSEFQNILYETMLEYADEVEFEEPNIHKSGSYSFLDSGYIDHYRELDDFIDALFHNKKLLASAIIQGILETGNDNSDYYPEDLEGDYTFYKCN